SDDDYQKAGATVVPEPVRLFGESEILVKVQRPTADEAARLGEGSVLVSQLQPVLNLDIVRALAARRVTAFSMDLIPRISRAQSMDALSSQAAASGYKAVLLAA